MYFLKYCMLISHHESMKIWSILQKSIRWEAFARRGFTKRSKWYVGLPHKNSSYFSVEMYCNITHRKCSLLNSKTLEHWLKNWFMLLIQFTAYASCNEDCKRFCCNLFLKKLIYVKLHYMESRKTGFLGFVWLFVFSSDCSLHGFFTILGSILEIPAVQI